jgi:hypothetical protein
MARTIPTPNARPSGDLPVVDHHRTATARSRDHTGSSSTAFADDLLRGAAEIAEFIFGSRKFRRKVYYLCASSRLPVFRLGARICALKSDLLKFFSSQAERSLGRRG